MKFTLALPLLLFSFITSAQEPPQPFTAGKINLSLVAAEFATRAADAYTTRVLVHRGYYERGSFCGRNLQPVADSAPAEYAYSFGAAAFYTIAAERLWTYSNRARGRTRTALHLISLSVMLSDTVYDGWAVAHNAAYIASGKRGERP